MNLESQVCSHELSKRLRELGVKQESVFYWEERDWKVEVNEDGYEKVLETKIELCMPPIFDLARSNDFWSAFTVAELGEMLPTLWWDSGKRGEGDYICRVFKENVTKIINSFGQTEVEARAKMLINLIENKLLQFKDI